MSLFLLPVMLQVSKSSKEKGSNELRLLNQENKDINVSRGETLHMKGSKEQDGRKIYVYYSRRS